MTAPHRLLAVLCLALGSAGMSGFAVAANSAPQRVVSLSPALTEMVCALDACPRLVGVDGNSNWPAEVQALPQLGVLGQNHVEQVVRLKPDLVLVPRSARIAVRLRSLGLWVLELEPQNMQEAQVAFNQVASALGWDNKKAPAYWQAQQARLESISAQAKAQLAKNTPPKNSVYFEVGSGPYAASTASYTGEILARFGLQNIVPANLGSYPKINPELIVRSRPHWAMWTGAAQEKPAVWIARAPQQCRFTGEQADALVRPGVRMVQAAQAIALCLLAQ